MVDYIQFLRQQPDTETSGKSTDDDSTQFKTPVERNEVSFPFEIIYEAQRLNGVYPPEYRVNLQSGTVTCVYRNRQEMEDHIYAAVLVKDAVELGGVPVISNVSGDITEQIKGFSVP